MSGQFKGEIKALVYPYLRLLHLIYDRLDENGYFIQYLHKEVEFTFPGYGKMKGHTEFNLWYHPIKEQLEAPIKHEVVDLTIEETERN